MLIEQTHFPLGGGPNWNKIIIISLVCIVAGTIAYKAFVKAKTVTKPSPVKIKNNDKKIIKETEETPSAD